MRKRRVGSKQAQQLSSGGTRPVTTPIESLAAELGELNAALDIVQLVASDVELMRDQRLNGRENECELDRDFARFETIVTSRIEVLEKALAVSQPHSVADILIMLVLYRSELELEREELVSEIRQHLATLPTELAGFLIEAITRSDDRADYFLGNIIQGLQQVLGVSPDMVGLEQYVYDDEVNNAVS